MVIGDDQDVGWCLWSDVSKGRYRLILIENVAFCFASNYPAEDAALPGCAPSMVHGFWPPSSSDLLKLGFQFKVFLSEDLRGDHETL